MKKLFLKMLFCQLLLLSLVSLSYAGQLEGEAWLLLEQNGWGYWGITVQKPDPTSIDHFELYDSDISRTAFRDNKEAGFAILMSDPNNQAVNGAVQKMVESEPVLVENISQKIQLLNIKNIDTFLNISKLLTYQNIDGGFAAVADMPSSPLDSAWAVIALSAVGHSDLSVMDRALDYLMAMQNIDGGFGFFDYSDSNIYMTSQVLIAVGSDVAYSVARSNAIAFLLARRNLDGGFGEGGVSGVLDTAWAFRALALVGGADSVVAAGVDSYLVASQLPLGDPAAGSWGGDVYTTALALQALAVMKANLSVGLISVIQADPAVGETVTISVEVKNSGVVDAANVLVRFFDGDPAVGGVQIGGDVTVPSIAAGGLFNAQVSWVLPSFGLETIFVEINPNYSIPEITQSDNIAKSSFNVLTQADLAIATPDISFIPEDVLIGDLFNISVDIYNLGEKQADNVVVRFYEGDDIASKVMLVESIIPAIGGSSHVVASLALTGVEGGHTYWVEADPGGLIVEGDEANNLAGNLLVVRPSVANAANLTLSGAPVLSFNPATADAGSLISVNANLTNSGLSDASNILIFAFNGDPDIDGSFVGAAEVATLAAGASTPINIPWYSSVYDSGFSEIHLIIDPFNEVIESSEADNRVFASIGLSLPPLPDLQVASITYTPAIFQSEVTITASITNNGTADAVDAGVDIYMDAPDLPPPLNLTRKRWIGKLNVPFIAAGSGADAVVTFFPLRSEAGAHRLTVDVDPVGLIDEQVETDNQLVTNFDILMPQKPDLEIGGIGFTPTASISGDIITITANIANSGVTDALGTIVGFYDGNPAAGGLQIGTDVTIASIVAGGSADVTVTLDTIGRIGINTIFAVVDADNLIDELYESNNTSFAGVDIGGVDLAIFRSDISYSIVDPMAGDLVTINADIHNSGSSSVLTDISFYDGDPASGGVLIGTTQVTATGNSTTVASVDWSVGAASSLIFVWADPLALTADIDQSNNLSRRPLSTVLKPVIISDLSLGESVISPASSPFIKDGIDIGYRLSDAKDIKLAIFAPDGSLARVFGPIDLHQSGNNLQWWDGIDNNGQVVMDSGSYVYKIGATLPEMMIETRFEQAVLNNASLNGVGVYGEAGSEYISLLKPDTDLMVSSYTPDVPHDGTYSMTFANTPVYQTKAFYKIDTAEFNGIEVTSAEWRFRVSACSGIYGCSPLSSASVDSVWSPDTISWNNQPVVSTILTPTQSASSPICCGIDKVVDLTALVAGWLDGSIVNNGFAIIPDYTTYGESVIAGLEIEWYLGGAYAWEKPQLLINGVDIASGRYPESGKWSALFDSGASSTDWGELVWQSVEPVGTSVSFRTRSAASIADLPWASWSDYYTTSGEAITSAPLRYIEVEALLTSADPGVTPQFSSVVLNGQAYIEPELFYNEITKESGSRLDITSGVAAVMLDNGGAGLFYSDGLNILSATSFDGLLFTPDSGFRLSADPLGMDINIGEVDIIRLDNGSYRLFYSANDGLTDRIFSAVSTDGTSFVKEGVIFENSSYASINSPDIVKLATGVYRLYYSGFDGVASKILSAISVYGTSFIAESGIRATGSSSSIYGDNTGSFTMLAAGSGIINKLESVDGLNFVPVDQFIAGDVSLDALGVLQPEVIRLIDGTFRAYYTGNDGAASHILSARFAEGGVIEVDNNNPAAIISSVDTATGVIRGSANDNEGFVSYSLKYSKDGMLWNEIASSTTPVNSGQLGLWDVAELLNGTYTLQLSAADMAGNEKNIYRQVLLASDVGLTSDYGYDGTPIAPVITGPTDASLTLASSPVSISGISGHASTVELFRSSSTITAGNRVDVTLASGLVGGNVTGVRLTGGMLSLGEKATNQALGSLAVSSNPSNQYPPSNAIDGNIGSKWILTNPVAFPEYLELDLGSVQELSRIKWIIDERYGMIQDYKVVASTNGRFNGEEVTITSGKMEYSVNNEPTYEYIVADNMKILMRYIRFVALSKIDSLSGNGGLAEFEIYTRYADSGTFTSDIFDVGGLDLQLDNISWVEDIEAGDTVSVEIKSGSTGLPDGSWTGFAPVINGQNPLITAKYFQYRITLLSSNGVTPLLSGFNISGHLVSMVRAGSVASDGGSPEAVAVSMTSRADFEAGSSTNLRSDITPGSLLLAMDETDNLALKDYYSISSITASSSWGNFNPYYAIDGITYLSYTTNYWIADSSPSWIQVDLGGDFPISRIWWHASDLTLRPENYRVYFSDTGEFNGEETLVTSGVQAGTTIDYSLAEYLTGRFVRIYLDTSIGRGGISEIRIFGGHLSSGSFTSDVYDLGADRKEGKNIKTGVEVPVGTSLTLKVRSGNAALPDLSWGNWQVINATTDIAALSGRYMQFMGDFTSSSQMLTPRLDGITFATKGEDGYFNFNNIALEPGINRFAARVNDGTEKSEFSTEVLLDYNNMPPLAQITAPAAGSILAGIVPVTGSSDGGYSVAYKKAGDVSFTQIGRVVLLPVFSGILANWDTMSVADGDYTLRLRAVNQPGPVSTTEIGVIVNNNPPDIPLLAGLPAVVNDAAISISGTAEAGGSVEVGVGGNIYNGTTDSSGNFTVAGVILSEGANTITAVAIDVAGSRSGSAAVGVILRSVDLAVSLDKPIYIANDPLVANISVTHLGSSALALSATIVLEDSANNLVATIANNLSVSFVDGSAGLVNLLPVNWNTGSTLSGSYNIRVIIFLGGLTYADSLTPLTISPEVSFDLLVTTNRMEYGPDESVMISSAISNTSSNYHGANITVTTTVTNSALATLFTKIDTITQLLRGGYRNIASNWNSGNHPPGVYEVKSSVSENGQFVSDAVRNFSIIPTGALSLSGSVTINPAMIFSGDPVAIGYSLTNNGNVDLTGAGVKMLIVDTDFLTYDTIAEPPVDLLMGASANGTLNITTNTYSAKDYMVILRGVVGGIEETIAGGYFRVQGAPTSPALNSPPDNSEVAIFTPTLTVNNSADPNNDTVTYDFELYSDAALSLPIARVAGVVQGVATTGWPVPVGLVENSTYYWRAGAFDGYGYSQWMPTASFFVNTINDPPASPVLASPTDGGQVASLTPLLSVINAVDPDSIDFSYNFEVATDIGMVNIVASVTGVAQGIATTSWQVGLPLLGLPLSDNTTYYWRAQADDFISIGVWSAPASFFVNLANDAPSTSVGLSPVDGSTVTIAQPSLEVSNSTDLDGDIVTYTFEMDTTLGFNSGDLIVSPAISQGITSTIWSPIAPLTENSIWYWRVKASDPFTSSAYSTTMSIFVNTINDSPSIPANIYPAEATEVLTLTPELTLGNAIDPDGDTLTYAYEVYADAALTQMVTSASGVAEQLMQTSRMLPVGLAENAVYYWRGAATDGLLSSGWSGATSFLVNSANDAPSDPVVSSPLDQATVETLTPTLTIANSTDPDSDILTYTFEIYSDSATSLLVASANGITEGPASTTITASTSWTLTAPLADNTTYYWRARSFDGDRYSAWSVQSAFNVHMPTTGLSVKAKVKFQPKKLKLNSDDKWVKVKVKIPGNYLASDVDVASIRLNGQIAPDMSHYKIKVKHKHDHSHKHGKHYHHKHDHENDHDHHHNDELRSIELKLKFDRSAVIAIMPQLDSRAVITITGNIGSDTFEGIDIIKLKQNHDHD